MDLFILLTPGSAASTLPVLLTIQTPLVVPLGVFLKPIAEISVAFGSHNSVYGRFCFVLKVVLDLVESVESPNIE